MSPKSWQGAKSAAAVLIVGFALGLVRPDSLWALSVVRCVSNDNHVYVIVTTTSDRTQVTSLAMTNMNANACCESPAAGAVLTTLAAGGGILLPNRARTTVLSGFTTNSITCGANFSASAAGGQGQLTLPGGLRTVSSNGGFTTETVVPVTTADGAVPAAFDASGVSRSIPGCSVSGQTMVFPSTAGTYTPSDVTLGEQASQTVTHDDTEGSTIGNRAPGNNVPPTQASPDGFLLEGDCSNPATCQIIVFIATQDSSIGAGLAASSFTLDASDFTRSTECSANNVIFNSPTPTVTNTATVTATSTETATNTATATNTVTATSTATSISTATASSTASLTPTTTSTPTITPTPTPTRVGICSLTPVSGCATPVGFKKRLRISQKKDLTTWRWRTQGSIPVADFGSPSTTTTISLCIYAGASPTLVEELQAPAAGTCVNGKPCWKSKGAKGWRYRDHSRSHSGISRIALRTTPPALADIALRSRGPLVPIPPLPLAQPVIAQMVKSDGPQCWQSNYSAPALKNNPDTYLDKND